MAKNKLNPLAFGYAAAILSSVSMLILGVLGNLGVSLGAVEIMQKYHIYFSLSIGGIIAGIVEAAIFSFVVGYVFVWLYNYFL